MDGIERERGILREVRANADLVIDTSNLNVHEFRKKIVSFFGGEQRPGLMISVVSFGYKNGLPVDADLVVDCRFLTNPHWVPELRPMSGLDAPVREYVLDSPARRSSLTPMWTCSASWLQATPAKGRFMPLWPWVARGQAPSVAMAEALGVRLRERGMEVQVNHRDVVQSE